MKNEKNKERIEKLRAKYSNDLAIVTIADILKSILEPGKEDEIIFSVDNKRGVALNGNTTVAPTEPQERYFKLIDGKDWDVLEKGKIYPSNFFPLGYNHNIKYHASEPAPFHEDWQEVTKEDYDRQFIKSLFEFEDFKKELNELLVKYSCNV